jgi:hypothetical protein
VHSDQSYQSQNVFPFTFESSHSVMAARNCGVLPLQRDFDASKFDKVKHSVTHSINNVSSKTQVEIPKLSIGASRMELISFITEFRRSATTMRWTNGPILFETFPMHLQVSDLDTWNIIILNAAQTVVSFGVCLDSLKRSKFLEDAYDKQVTFLRLIKKPVEMEPSAFAPLLLYHNILMAELPGAPSD